MTETEPGITWYAIMTGPREEFHANAKLRRAGYWTYCPFERIRRKKKLPNREQFKIETAEVPHFPRYIFAALTKRGQSVYEINETDGVSTVVYCGEEPLPIPHSVMDELMSRADNKGCVGIVDRTARKRFQPGEEVRIIDASPFAGLIGQIERDAGGKTRVWLESFKNPVEVDPELLESIAGLNSPRPQCI